MKAREHMKNEVSKKMFKKLKKHVTPTTSRQKKKLVCYYCNKAYHIKSCSFKYFEDLGIPRVRKQEWRVKQHTCFVAYKRAGGNLIADVQGI